MANNRSYDYLFKLLVIGDSGVGKTCMVARFTEDAYGNFPPTTGIDVKIKTLNIDGKRVKLQMWDTAGKERFREVTKTYFSGTRKSFYHGIMIVYDVRYEQSFHGAVNWIKEIKRHADENVVKMILGNKCDQQESRRVSTERGKQLAQKHQVKFMETSAFASIHVDQAFHTLARDIFNKISGVQSLILEETKDHHQQLENAKETEHSKLQQLAELQKRLEEETKKNELYQQQQEELLHCRKEELKITMNLQNEHAKTQLQLAEMQKRLEEETKANDLHQQQEELLKHQIEQLEETIQHKQAKIVDLQNQLESRPWILEREEVQLTNEKIGGGAYGEVRVAIFRGTEVAAKLLHELIVSRHNRSIFTREMDISSKIHHPNIVQFIGATRVDNPILLYELMATSLYKRLQQDESLSCPQIAEICCNIASALCYLHQWRPDPIIHRDVSSPNVLMEPLANNRWKSKLSDFGSASLQLHVKTVIPGNPAYAAPEAIVPQHHTPAMDVYSFGVLATEMALHCAPEMDSGRREERAYDIDWTPLKTIVLKCICNDHNQRLTSAQLMNELLKLGK